MTPVFALIQFQDDFAHDIESDGLIIDYDGSGASDTYIQFGNDLTPTNNGTLNWNISSDEFEFDADVSFLQNEIRDVAFENLPSAPGTPVSGQIYHNTSDGNTYIYNGSVWEDITAVGGGSVDLDGAYDNDLNKRLDVDSLLGLEFQATTLTGDIIFDLQSTSDVVIQNAGSTFALFRDDGVFELTDTQDTERIRLTDQSNLDSVSIYTGLGSPDSVLSAERGSLFLDQLGVLYVNTSLLGLGTSWVALDDTDADTLDSLDSLQFLRSDTSDNYTSGILTFDPGTTLDIDGNIVNLDEITNSTFTLDSDNAGAGTDVDLVANQGSDNPGTLRYNATTNQWEISNDGGVFLPLSTGSGDFEDVYSDDGDNTLTTANGDFTINTGTGDVLITSNDWSVDAAGNISMNSGIVEGTLDANGIVSLGDGGDDIAIDSDDWDISSAGIASGLTGISSTGEVNFAGTAAFRIREDADPSTNAACANLGELILDSTDEQIQLCTGTGGAGVATWTPLDVGTLDGLDSLQFLRSDSSDNYTSGTLTFDPGTVLDIDGNIVNLDEITNATLTLDSDNVGVGTNIDLVANQGSDNPGTLRYNATTNQWEISNDGGTFDAIATASSISLDDAYNNFAGVSPTITVDSAEGQTEGIVFGGVLAGDETVTISNSGNGGVLLLENTGTGDSFRVNDEASDTTPFLIDDTGSVTVGNELSLSAFGSSRGSTITDPADVPADIDGYLVVDSTGNVEQLQSNEGVVKINGDVNGKPSFTAVAGVEYQITYTSPLTISSATDWPESDLADESSFYDFGADKVLENPVQYQQHLFRVIVNYSGFTTGGTDKIILRLYNPLSGFELIETADVPKGFTFGSALFDLWTIADSDSIGNGYELYLSTTDDSSLEVDSITRFSFHKD